MKTAAAFALGFAAGMGCLALVLWSTGSLGPGQALAAPMALGAMPLNDTHLDQGGRRQPAAVPPAVQPTETLPAAPSPAPVEPDSGPWLGMPVAGVDPRTLHSNFSQARGAQAHEALDIMAPRGTEVMAVAGGNVVKLFTSKPGGLTVYQFDDSRMWCYYYAHLDRYAAGLKEGMLLRKGEVLGYVGSTGNASPNAPHLHLAVFRLGPGKNWWQGTAVDPLPLLR
jgi:murein DD-endopeptidase MepM/ murein hydrolase activator NlpD